MKVTFELASKFKNKNDLCYKYKTQSYLGVCYFIPDKENEDIEKGEATFYYDDVNRCIKNLQVQSDKTSQKAIAIEKNEKVFAVLNAIDIRAKKKVKINYFLFKLLSFFNLCEEV